MLSGDPEGKKTGLVKNLALSAYVTVGTDPHPVRDMINAFLSGITEPPLEFGMAKIFLNGAIVGEIRDPKSLVAHLVRARRSLKISRETSIAYFDQKNEIQVSTEEGRLSRPLLVVENGKLLLKMDMIEKLRVGEMTWSQLLGGGTVELIDKVEEETTRIALFPSDLTDVEVCSKIDPKVYTHCEMNPSLILGIGGSIIPFPDHNQCIYQEEEVLMKDGSRKKIKDVKLGDTVKNFDPLKETIGAATVTNVVVKETTKQMYQLTLRGGRSIIATYDHRFFTMKGWKMVDLLKVGDMVSILSEGGKEIRYAAVDKKVAVATRHIADITTDSPHQSFFCNTFGVHNSPRNTYQCIWKEEPVLMGNGEWKKIKDIKVGDVVVTFDPITLIRSVTKVIHAHTAPTDKKMLRLTTPTIYSSSGTVGGRSIIVTEDHKIMTYDGWMEAGKITERSHVILTGHWLGPRNKVQVEWFTHSSVRIKEVPNVEISDITTESENHSFIAGDGFYVHNSAMGKQAIGIPFTNYKHIMSGTFHTMMYLQKPLALSRAASIIGFDEMPAGLNAMTAICPRPFNEEDSIEMNQDAIDAGFMNSLKHICYYAEINEEKEEEFAIPEEEKCNKFKGNPKTLGPEGFALPGTKLNTGDMVIGRIAGCHSDDPQKKPYNNCSSVYEHQWSGVVDSVQTGTTCDGYPYYRVMVSQLRLPIVGDKFCYSPDHDVLTTKGWIPIANVTKEHTLATLNDNEELEYQKPTEILTFEHAGKMVEVDSKQVRLTVTPNHKMYVRFRSGDYKLVEADKLFDTHVHYKKDAVWNVPGLAEFVLPSYWQSYKKGDRARFYYAKKLHIEPWLTFFGIWMAEGCVCHGNNMIMVAINKQRVKDALYKALQDMGIEYIIEPKELLRINHRQLCMYLKPLSPGDINKYLPDWVWDLNMEQSRLLLHSLCLGDGHANENTPMYNTSSVRLKDDITRLALHCGWAANSHIRSFEGTHKTIAGRDSVTHADAWRMTIVKTQVNPAVNKHIKGQQKYIEYTGFVHCVTVPNRIIYVRNRGEEPSFYQNPVWCGNSYRNGQKGTVGKKQRSQDFPFNSQGITPDVIMNSLALPSRMTIAMIIELVTGKLVSMTSPLQKIKLVDFGLGAKDEEGNVVEPEDPDVECKNTLSQEFIEALIPEHRTVDATPFRKKFSMELIEKELKRYGAQYGDELLTDGVTGEPLRALIFLGLCYHQKLKHMTIDKKHSRARGGRTALVRQPMEGRAAGGGLRCGTMEKDCLLGQGSARFARDRLMEQSDEYRTWVCSVCGLPAFTERQGTVRECRVCATNKVAKIRLPYGTKLANQELMSMNIVPRILTTPYNSMTINADD